MFCFVESNEKYCRNRLTNRAFRFVEITLPPNLSKQSRICRKTFRKRPISVEKLSHICRKIPRDCRKSFPHLSKNPPNLSKTIFSYSCVLDSYVNILGSIYYIYILFFYRLLSIYSSFIDLYKNQKKILFLFFSFCLLQERYFIAITRMVQSVTNYCILVSRI